MIESTLMKRRSLNIFLKTHCNTISFEPRILGHLPNQIPHLPPIGVELDVMTMTKWIMSCKIHNIFIFKSHGIVKVILGLHIVLSEFEQFEHDKICNSWCKLSSKYNHYKSRKVVNQWKYIYAFHLSFFLYMLKMCSDTWPDGPWLIGWWFCIKQTRHPVHVVLVEWQTILTTSMTSGKF